MNGFNTTDIEIWLDFLEVFFDEQRDFFDWSEIIYKILIYIIFFASLFGNLLTCFVIYYDRTMHTTTNYYLFNLAISDIILSTAIFHDLVEPSKFLVAYSRLACKLYFLIVLTVWNNGVLTLTTIAIERYLGICCPFKMKKKGWSDVAKIISIIWLVAVLEAVPEVYLVNLVI